MRYTAGWNVGNHVQCIAAPEPSRYRAYSSPVQDACYTIQQVLGGTKQGLPEKIKIVVRPGEPARWLASSRFRPV
jgi:hypothetical protein